jgi:hypothetical protein
MSERQDMGSPISLPVPRPPIYKPRLGPLSTIVIEWQSRSQTVYPAVWTAICRAISQAAAICPLTHYANPQRMKSHLGRDQ